MKILLLHPSDAFDDPRWSNTHWDLIVDLGISSQDRSEFWAKKLGCPVHQMHLLRSREHDFRRLREVFVAGCGRLLDRNGLDWWRIMSILLHEQLEAVLLIQRLRHELPGQSSVYCSRGEWPVTGLIQALRVQPHIFRPEGPPRFASRLHRYSRAARRLSFSQIRDVIFDKYDAAYRWRSRWHRISDVSERSVVLVPTAYSNVSRSAAAYARMLPQQEFLFVATRESALTFDVPSNVRVEKLAAFARSRPDPEEVERLLKSWDKLRQELQLIPEIAILESVGALGGFGSLLRQGIALRNAWSKAISRGNATAVFCGDDSNHTTRIAVEVASARGIPTVDFHHGALDGRYLFKTLPSEVYLAKGEMERDYLVGTCGLHPARIIVGGPPRAFSHPGEKTQTRDRVVLFSEPYENQGARPMEIYQEIIPPLLHLCRSAGTRLVIKLHPFESKSERECLMRKLLSAKDLELVDLVTGPMSEDLLNTTWFGVTVESTAALDCASRGVPCFLCSWLEISAYGYVQQYARFGVGQILKSASELLSIPAFLQAQPVEAKAIDNIWSPISPDELRDYLVGKTSGVHQKQLTSFGMSA